MRRTSLKMQLQLALCRLGDYNRVLRQGKSRAVLSSGLREKHAVPLGAAGRNVIDVQDQFWKTLIKNARLHLEGDLRGDQVRLYRSKRSQRQGAQPPRHSPGHYRAR